MENGIHVLLPRLRDPRTGDRGCPSQPPRPGLHPRLGRRMRPRARTLHAGHPAARADVRLCLQQRSDPCHRHRSAASPAGHFGRFSRTGGAARPAEIVQKYFRPARPGPASSKSCRSCGRKSSSSHHDLLSLRPIRRGALSLIVCKNVLLHFDEAQRFNVLQDVPRALQPGRAVGDGAHAEGPRGACGPSGAGRAATPRFIANSKSRRPDMSVGPENRRVPPTPPSRPAGHARPLPTAAHPPCTCRAADAADCKPTEGVFAGPTTSLRGAHRLSPTSYHQLKPGE